MSMISRVSRTGSIGLGFGLLAIMVSVVLGIAAVIINGSGTIDLDPFGFVGLLIGLVPGGLVLLRSLWCHYAGKPKWATRERLGDVSTGLVAGAAGALLGYFLFSSVEAVQEAADRMH